MRGAPMRDDRATARMLAVGLLRGVVIRIAGARARVQQPLCPHPA